MNKDIQIWLDRMKRYLEEKAALNAHNLELFKATDTEDVEEAYELGRYNAIVQAVRWFDPEYLTFDPVEIWEEFG